MTKWDLNGINFSVEIIALTLYLLFAALSFGIAGLSFFLARRYGKPYLKLLFYGMLGYAIFSFFDFIAIHFAHLIFDCSSTPVHTLNTIKLIFNLIALPALLISTIMVIRVFQKVEKRKSRVPVLGMVIAAFTILIVIFGVHVSQYAAAKGAAGIKDAEQLRTLIKTALWIWLIAGMSRFLFGLTVKNPSNRIWSVFARYYAIAVFIHGILVWITTDEYILCNIYPVLELLLPLPAIGYLCLRLSAHFKTDSSASSMNRGAMDAYFERMGLTEREAEVAWLIVSGDNNRQIEDKLFISYMTVKTHVYKIFKKLKVKNRYQLINLVHNCTDVPKAE